MQDKHGMRGGMARRNFLAAAPLSAWFGSGAGGLPAAAPVDFATLRLPASPNACLAGPPGGNPASQITIPPFRADPDRAFAALRTLGGRFPRTTPLADWPAQRQAQWVTRSALMNFPDLIAGAIVALPGGGSGLYLFSRSLFGYSDLGVNRARVEAWIAELRTALGEA
jgi:uncharacterized protein (DUF1499 family)